VYSRRHRKHRVLFAFWDVVLVALAFEAAYLTRAYLHLERLFFLTLSERALLLGFCAVAWPVAGLWLETYDRLDTRDPRVTLRDTFRQCLYGSLCLVVFQFSLRLDLSRPFLGFFAFYSWFFVYLFRLTAGRLLLGLERREFGTPHQVLIAGCGERARRIARAIELSASHGARLAGFLDEQAGALKEGADYPVYPYRELPELLRRQVIDEIIFAVDSERLAALEEIFLLCDEEGVRTRVAVDFFPHIHSDVYLDRLASTPLLTFSATPHDEIRLMVKRVTDVILASAGLLAMLPLMLLIAAAVKLTSRGPVLFRQQRCGLNGRRFTFYKFRSMVDNAEELKASLEHLNERTTAFKIRNDPRLTPTGKFLRKFSIDEWPQLWNVIRGDMSLVGPRPAVPSEVEKYARWQRRRLRMRPGLTCLWAVSGRDAVDFDTWMRMDMQYIDTWSLALDWKILLRTIPRVLSGQGAS
jgi:exopolysaccharide biosynthesis polyprenyl glycosylphosphotransferase